MDDKKRSGLIRLISTYNPTKDIKDQLPRSIGKGYSIVFKHWPIPYDSQLNLFESYDFKS